MLLNCHNLFFQDTFTALCCMNNFCVAFCNLDRIV